MPVTIRPCAFLANVLLLSTWQSSDSSSCVNASHCPWLQQEQARVHRCCMMVHCVCVHPFVTSKRPRTIQSTGTASQMIHPANIDIQMIHPAKTRAFLWPRVSASTCVPSPGPSAGSWSQFGITFTATLTGPAALGGASEMAPDGGGSLDVIAAKKSAWHG